MRNPGNHVDWSRASLVAVCSQQKAWSTSAREEWERRRFPFRISAHWSLSSSTRETNSKTDGCKWLRTKAPSRWLLTFATGWVGRLSMSLVSQVCELPKHYYSPKGIFRIWLQFQRHPERVKWAFPRLQGNVWSCDLPRRCYEKHNQDLCSLVRLHYCMFPYHWNGILNWFEPLSPTKHILRSRDAKMLFTVTLAGLSKRRSLRSLRERKTAPHMLAEIY